MAAKTWDQELGGTDDLDNGRSGGGVSREWKARLRRYWKYAIKGVGATD